MQQSPNKRGSAADGAPGAMQAAEPPRSQETAPPRTRHRRKKQPTADAGGSLPTPRRGEELSLHASVEVVLEAVLDGDGDIMSKKAGKKVRVDPAPAAGPSAATGKAKGRRRTKTLADHRQSLDAQNSPRVTLVEPSASGSSTPQSKTKPRTTRNSLKTPISPGLPDSPAPKRRRRRREPFDRPSKTAIFKDIDAFFPSREEEGEEGAIWLQRDGFDIISPTSWRVRDVPDRAMSRSAPTIRVTAELETTEEQALADRLRDGLVLSETQTQDTMISEAVSAMEPMSLPLRTGNEAPSADGIAIPRMWAQPRDASECTDNLSGLSQGSYRHQALQAHVESLRREEEREKWGYRDAFAEGEMSPVSTEKYFFTGPPLDEPSLISGAAPSSSVSEGVSSAPVGGSRSSRRPSNPRIPSLAAINTSVGGSSPSSAPSMQLIRGRMLGRGAHGQCYLAQDVRTMQLYALKEVLPQRDPVENRRVLGSLWEEIRLLSSLRHENIVQVVGLTYNAAPSIASTPSTTTGTPVTPYSAPSLPPVPAPVPAPQMILEYVSGGSIGSLMQSLDPLPFPPALAAYFARQVASGLAYLHANGVIHRDVKGTNILVTVDGTAKISDFGISVEVTDPLPPRIDGQTSAKRGKGTSAYDAIAQTQPQGTPFWMPPEALTRRFSAKVDCWGLGCLVLEMLSGRHPWPHMDKVSVLFRLGDPNPENRIPPLPPVLGTETLENAYPPQSNVPRSILDPTTPIPGTAIDVDVYRLGILNLSRRNVVVTAEARRFMEDCLQPDPTMRPTAEHLLSHPFLNTGDGFVFSERWPELLAAASALQPQVEAFDDITAVHDAAGEEEDVDEEEEEELEMDGFEDASGSTDVEQEEVDDAETSDGELEASEGEEPIEELDSELESEVERPEQVGLKNAEDGEDGQTLG